MLCASEFMAILNLPSIMSIYTSNIVNRCLEHVMTGQALVDVSRNCLVDISPEVKALMSQEDTWINLRQEAFVGAAKREELGFPFQFEIGCWRGIRVRKFFIPVYQFLPKSGPRTFTVRADY
jgi:hypothetical protein